MLLRLCTNAGIQAKTFGFFFFFYAISHWNYVQNTLLWSFDPQDVAVSSGCVFTHVRLIFTPNPFALISVKYLSKAACVKRIYKKGCNMVEMGKTILNKVLMNCKFIEEERKM